LKTIIKKVFEEDDPPDSYIKRFGDNRARALVSAGEWTFASKSLWKEKIRDAVKKEEKVEKPKKKKKKKKGSKKDE